MGRDYLENVVIEAQKAWLEACIAFLNKETGLAEVHRCRDVMRVAIAARNCLTSNVEPLGSNVVPFKYRRLRGPERAHKW